MKDWPGNRAWLDAAEYKHVVLGLIFLKYISDAFTERHDWLLKEAACLWFLTPGRYVGAEEIEDDDEPFDETADELDEDLRYTDAHLEII
jgi:hypothetical protein